MADPILHRLAIEELEFAIKRRSENPVLVRGRVEWVLRSMVNERLSVEVAAARLGLLRRTLARRLQEAGTSSRVLLDNETHRRAVRRRESKLGRDEIALRLGYQYPGSFNRAWHRRFGPASA